MGGIAGAAAGLSCAMASPARPRTTVQTAWNVDRFLTETSLRYLRF
jgi:hypothetical protein